MRSFWQNLSAGRQLLAVAIVVPVLTAVLIGAYFIFRPSYQVMFSELRPQDAATIVAELERQKVPYRLADGGATVQVPADQVHEARLKVMSRDLPLKGTVGFELFNNADLGLTEFAQKVNYQRALQGELARTIMALAEIESARVHISLPDSGLFRRNGAKPRASVALLTRAGQELPPETVRGIQRLVAAGVPELEPFDVTIIDQRGAPMGGARAGDVVSDRKLELKIELERYYARKLSEQIASVVGASNAQISVDVDLNFDQIRVTQETTGSGTRRRIETPARSNEAAFLAPERNLINDDGSVPVQAERPRSASVADVSQRKVEQIVSAPGSIRRMQVGVLLHSPLDAAAAEQLRQLIFAAAGLSAERGDSVVLFARERFAAKASAEGNTAASAAAAPTAAPASTGGEGAWVDAAKAASLVPSENQRLLLALGVIALVVLLAAAGLVSRRGRGVRALSENERLQRVAQLRAALQMEQQREST